MIPTSLRFAFAVIGGLLAFDAAGGVLRGADDPTVVSRWKAQDVQVDGRADEWTQLAAIPKGPMVAALNDAESLYLVVATEDATVRRTLATGLVVWLDPSATRKADIGLQLPGSFILAPGAKPGKLDINAQPASPDAIDEVDWLGPGKRRQLLTITPELGVAMASGTEARMLAYEIRLPLVTSAAHPFAVGAQPGRTIALGLFTPDVPKTTRQRDRDSSSGSYGGGYNPYDPYGTGGYGGIGTGMAPPPIRQSEPSPEKAPVMKLWLRLQLARQ